MWPILWCLLLSNDNYLLNILSQPNQPQLNILSQPKQPQLNILSQPNQPQLDILSQSNQPQLDIFSQPNQPQLNILSQPNQPQHDILSQPKIRILPPPDKDFDKQRNGWDISPLCGIFKALFQFHCTNTFLFLPLMTLPVEFPHWVIFPPFPKPLKLFPYP